MLAQDPPCFGGSQHVDGAILAQARTDKETTYPELVASNQCRLVVDTGGPWSEKALDIFRQLAFARAREVPPAMKWQVVLAWDPHVGQDMISHKW